MDWDGVFDAIETTNAAFTVTRHGIAVAVLLSVDEYELLVKAAT